MGYYSSYQIGLKGPPAAICLTVDWIRGRAAAASAVVATTDQTEHYYYGMLNRDLDPKPPSDSVLLFTGGGKLHGEWDAVVETLRERCKLLGVDMAYARSGEEHGDIDVQSGDDIYINVNVSLEPGDWYR